LNIKNRASVLLGGITVVLPAACTVNNTFEVTDFSTCIWYPATITGTATGQRVYGANCHINTANGLTSDIPGTIDGGMWNTVFFDGGYAGTRGSRTFNAQGYPGSASLPPNTWSVSTNIGIAGTGSPGNPRGLFLYDGANSYFAPATTAINHQTGTAYTTIFTDQEGQIGMDNVAANTLTVDTDANLTRYGIGLPVGTRKKGTQVNTGATTVVGAAGVTVHNAGPVGSQWESKTLYKRGPDEWVMDAAPQASGGGGVPGGNAGELQWNSAGAFGGITGSSVSASGAVTLAGGSIAVSDPILNLSQTWDDGGTWTTDFTAIKLNVTQVSGLNVLKLMDLQFDGTSVFSVLRSGQVTLAPFSAFCADYFFSLDGSTFIRTTDGMIQFSSGNEIVEQRNGNNAQAFRVYAAYTDATNYECGVLDWITPQPYLPLAPRRLAPV
jgi:hypothetical protein